MEQIEFDFGSLENKPKYEDVYNDMVIIFRKYKLLKDNEDTYQYEKQLLDILINVREQTRLILHDFVELQKKYGYNVDLFYNYNMHCGLNNKLGQHYTPPELALLTGKLTKNKNENKECNTIYEPTAGSGNLVWNLWSDRQQLDTRKDIYVLNDYDTRNIISLVISSAIRGMNCFITNCDTLSGKPMLDYVFMIQSESIFNISEVIPHKTIINHNEFLEYFHKVMNMTDEQTQELQDEEKI